MALVIAALWLRPHGHAATFAAAVVVSLAGAAMGCQSALSKLPTGPDHPSTVMTSSYTGWVLVALDAGFGRLRHADAETVRASRTRFVSVTALLLCFVFGASVGAFGEAWAGMA